MKTITTLFLCLLSLSLPAATATRIINLPERTSLNANDFLLVDRDATGVGKVRISSLASNVVLTSGGVIVKTNLSALASTTGATNGSSVFVAGNLTFLDWGPRLLEYVLDTSSSASTNRFAIANAGGSGRWLHDWDGNPAAWGAKADGVTDDGPALKAAFDYAVSNRVTLRLQEGTNRVVLSSLPNNTLFYLLATNATQADRNLRPTIVGNGKWRSRIQLEGPGTGIYLHGVDSGTFDGIGGVYLRGVRLEGFGIRGDGTNSQTGLDCKNVVFDGIFRDLLFEKLGSEQSRPAVNLDDCWNLQVDNLWWSPGGWGNFGIRNYGANQQLWTKFLSQGAVGNSTNSWDMEIDSSEGSTWESIALGSHARWGFRIMQNSGSGGVVNKIFGQSEGPATAFWFGRKPPASYGALTNLGNVAYLTVTNHAQFLGRYVTLAGVTPSAYNGTWFILSVPSTNQITLQLGSDPGAPGSGGTWQPDAWAENWDLSGYMWSIAGSIHNVNTNIDRPIIDISRGRNIRIDNSSMGSLHYRIATATNVSLQYVSNNVNGVSVFDPHIRAQFASHPFANGDVVSLRFLSNQLFSTYTSLSNVGSTAYLQSSRHNVLANDYVTVAGATPTNFNGRWFVNSITDSDNLIMTITSNAPASASGGYWTLDPVNAAVNNPGRATNITANEAWWPVPGLVRTSNRTNVLQASDLGSSSVVTAPAFAIRVSPDSWNIRLKDNIFFNFPAQWTIFDEQPWPPNTDTRILTWENQVPNVIIGTNLNNANTPLTMAQASVNPWNIFYRNSFLQQRPVAVHLKCLFQPTFLGAVTNEHVSFRLSSLAQDRVSKSFVTNAIQDVTWRCADTTVSSTYTRNVRVPTDQYGFFSYQILNPNPVVIGKFELTQVGVEVE